MPKAYQGRGVRPTERGKHVTAWLIVFVAGPALIVLNHVTAVHP